MNLRSKVILVASISVILVVLLINVIGHLIIIDGFHKIEVHNTETSLKNAQSFLDSELNYLDLKAQDWAKWDDMYNYILDRNDTFVERNLTDDTFANLDVNLVVITDKSGKVLYSRHYDYFTNQDMDVPEKFRQKIPADDKLISVINTGNPTSGIIAIEGHPMIVASCPVTDSPQKAPFAGCLIFGRCIEQAELTRIDRITGEKTGLYLTKTANLPPDVSLAFSKISEASPVYVQTLNSNRIAGYSLINDLYGSPELLLKLETDREVAAMGQVSYAYYVIASVLGALLTLLFAVFMLDRLVMRPIRELNSGVKQLAGDGDHSRRLGITGKDEISSLAQQINNMLETLEQSYHRIAMQDEKYKIVTENISDIIILLDMDLKILYFSPSTLRSRGYGSEELVALPLDKQVTPDSLSRALRRFDEMLRDEAANPGSFHVIDIDMEVYCKDGTTFWTENRFSPVRDEAGKVVNILCVGRDISSKKLSEKQLLVQRDLALKLSGAMSMNEAMRTCIETATEATGFDCGAVYMVKEEGKLNPMCLTGFSPAYLEAVALLNGKSRLRKKMLSDAPVYAGRDDNSDDIGEAEEREGIVAYALIPVYEKRGVVAYLFVGSHKIPSVSLESRRILEDITNQMGSVISRLKAEEELRESETKYQTLIESSASGVGIIQDGVYKYVNRTGARMFGYEREEVIGLPFLSLVGQEWMETVAERYRKRLAGQPAPDRYEVGMVCKDGSTKEVELFSSFISYEGKPATMAVITDITEKKLWENRRLVAQKLESIGVLAGGIAHDFNNILAAILGNISLARISDGQNSEVEEQLSKAEKACARAKDLTHQLLTFAKGGGPVKNTRSLIDLLRDSTNFALSGSNVKAEFNIARDLWPADVDVEQISRVIHNLVVNADQAMPKGGIVRVSAENTVLTDNNALSLPGGRFIKIAVEDHGEGISAHNIKYIFDPYFTTRQKGSGLGLAMTYSIVKNHGGTISVDSLVGTGTTFRIYLPASDQALPENLADTGKNYSLKGKRVLLVDDEEMIRDVTSRILKHMGIEEVLIAGDGREALRLYEQARREGRPVDVVIMDLTIPGGMGGKEAMQEMLKMDPATRAIVSSGYASDPILADYRKYGFKGMLIKPYKIQELDQVLGDVLSRPAE